MQSVARVGEAAEASGTNGIKVQAPAPVWAVGTDTAAATEVIVMNDNEVICASEAKICHEFKSFNALHTLNIVVRSKALVVFCCFFQAMIKPCVSCLFRRVLDLSKVMVMNDEPKGVAAEVAGTSKGTGGGGNSQAKIASGHQERAGDVKFRSAAMAAKASLQQLQASVEGPSTPRKLGYVQHEQQQQQGKNAAA